MLSLSTASERLTIVALLTASFAVAGLMWIFFTSNGKSRQSIALLSGLACGAVALLVGDEFKWWLLLSSLLCALAYRRSTVRLQEETLIPTQGTLKLFTVIGCISILALVFYRLGSYSILPLTWEATVIENLMAEIRSPDPLNSVASRLLWAEGLLSEGELSMLYGLPTLSLLSLWSSVFFTRAISALCMLGSVGILALFLRRFVGPSVAVISIFVLGLNELTLIFGRYGSSISATIFSVLLALLCCGRLVTRPTLVRALLAAGALYLATLGYAPGRIVVIILTFMTIGGVTLNRSVSPSIKLLTGALFTLSICLIIYTQHHYDRLRVFSSARHEQFFLMFGSGFWPEALDAKWRAYKQTTASPTTADYLSFGYDLLTTTTLQQLQRVAAPFPAEDRTYGTFSVDPMFLKLYAPALAPFLIIGMVMLSRRSTPWASITVWSWAIIGSIPLLLTNRIDSYRSALLMIPFSIWISVGIFEVLSGLRRIRFPRPITILGLCAGIVLAVLPRFSDLSQNNDVLPLTQRVINTLPEIILKSSVIAVEHMNDRIHALTSIDSLNRKQRGAPYPSEVLNNSNYHSLLDQFSEDNTQIIQELTEKISAGSHLVLGPESSCTKTARAFEERGFTVAQSETPIGRLLVISGATNVPQVETK